MSPSVADFVAKVAAERGTGWRRVSGVCNPFCRSLWAAATRGAIPFSFTSQLSVGAEPSAVSPASRSGFRPKRSSVRPTMVLAVPTSAWRMARSFDIDDDAELHVDQVFVGIGEERRSAHGFRPLRGRIGG
jgi:hypothetical protein